MMFKIIYKHLSIGTDQSEQTLFQKPTVGSYYSISDKDHLLWVISFHSEAASYCINDYAESVTLIKGRGNSLVKPYASQNLVLEHLKRLKSLSSNPKQSHFSG